MKAEKQPIQLFETYERKVKNFESIKNNEISLYACGPTVYDYAHIGNLRTYLFVDLLRRMFQFNGYSIRHVMNITDVGHLVSDGDMGEDKMEKGSRQYNKSAWDIALYFEECFFEDLKRLNINSPEVVSRATDHIEEQIAFIVDLEAKRFTYLTSDGIYFDTSKLDDYGYLARLNIDGLVAGARVDFVEKRNITDFALWKFSGDRKRQMEWESPWGKGFPGWHIECSAMAEKYLGPLFDIHVGGEDHIPVHHSNEIAQSQARHGTRLANYWMHGYFLQMDQQKVAKSENKSGKSLLLLDLIEREFDPLAYRYLVLTTHYRSRLNFTWNSLRSAATALLRLRGFVVNWPDHGEVLPYYYNQFLLWINRDLNIPRALAIVWDMISAKVSSADKKATLLIFDRVLGLGLIDFLGNSKLVPELVIALAEERQLARRKQNWRVSDELRNQIRINGYVVEDLKGGYRLLPLSLSNEKDEPKEK